MKQILLVITDELHAAIEQARGDAPRNPWLESELWRLASIKAGAKAANVEKPKRPAEGRGKYTRG